MQIFRWKTPYTTPLQCLISAISGGDIKISTPLLHPRNAIVSVSTGFEGLQPSPLRGVCEAKKSTFYVVNLKNSCCSIISRLFVQNKFKGKRYFIFLPFKICEMAMRPKKNFQLRGQYKEKTGFSFPCPSGVQVSSGSDTSATREKRSTVISRKFPGEKCDTPKEEGRERQRLGRDRRSLLMTLHILVRSTQFDTNVLD